LPTPLIFMLPVTSNLAAGAAVPMPTLPALVMRIHSCSVPLLVKKRTVEPLVSEAKKNPTESCPSRPLVAPVTLTWCVPVPASCSPALLPFTARLPATL